MFNDLSRHPGHHGLGWNVFGDDRAGGNDRSVPNVDPVGYGCPRPYPNIIFYDDALSRNSLLDKGTAWVLIDVIDGQQLNQG